MDKNRVTCKHQADVCRFPSCWFNWVTDHFPMSRTEAEPQRLGSTMTTLCFTDQQSIGFHKWWDGLWVWPYFGRDDRWHRGRDDTMVQDLSQPIGDWTLVIFQTVLGPNINHRPLTLFQKSKRHPVLSWYLMNKVFDSESNTLFLKYHESTGMCLVVNGATMYISVRSVAHSMVVPALGSEVRIQH